MILLLLAGLVVCFIYGVFSARDRALVFESPQTLHVGDREREYRVYAPSSEEPQPLVIALHGYRSDRSKSIEFYSGLSNLATEKHFVAVYPYGIENSWNGGFCCGTAFETNIDDVAFMRALVTELSQTYQIDQRKIYVVGMSNGGVMAQRLLAEMPDVVTAGVAVMSGVGDKDAVLDISKATAPLLLVNGTTDQYVPLVPQATGTSNGYTFLSAQETREAWASQYGLHEGVHTQQEGFEEYVYGSVDHPQLVARIYPTSHRWPQWRFTHPFTRVPTVTRDIWNFLNEYSL